MQPGTSRGEEVVLRGATDAVEVTLAKPGGCVLGIDEATAITTMPGTGLGVEYFQRERIAPLSPPTKRKCLSFRRAGGNDEVMPRMTGRKASRYWDSNWRPRR